MAGPMGKYVYIDDEGTSRAVRMPTWEAALQSPAAVAATTELPLPKGVQRRKRYYRIAATGKEGAVTCLVAADNPYAQAAGTAATIPLFGAAPPGSANATWQGRTGERWRT